MLHSAAFDLHQHLIITLCPNTLSACDSIIVLHNWPNQAKLCPFTPLYFYSDLSKAVPLLRDFFVCVSMVSYVAFIRSLFFPQLFFFWCLGKAVFRGCGFPGCFSLALCYLVLVFFSPFSIVITSLGE